MSAPFDPIDHHYVPQAYLRNFCFAYKGEEKLYAFDRTKVDLPTPRRFAAYTPAQVCYTKNLYRLRNRDVMKNFDVNDDNIVEKRAFTIYENNLLKIMEKLTLHSFPKDRRFITLGEALILIKTLLNMKKRNPFFMQSVSREDTAVQTNERFKEEMLADKEVWEARLRSEGLTLRDAFKQLDDLIDKPEFAQDLLRLSLYKEGMGETDNSVTRIADLLMTKKWYVYETAITDLFVTSDNPGYCLNQNEELFNTNFIEDFAFVFPLSPFHVLCIRNGHSDRLIPPCKEIILRKATPGYAQIVNRVTLANAYRYLYSNSQPTLVKTIHHWQEFMGENSIAHFPQPV